MLGRCCKLLAFFLLTSCCFAAEMGQTIQIYTHLDRIVGKPSWLILVYDADSPAVYPYIFKITRKDDAFLIFTRTNNYRVVSSLQFDDSNHKINDFCDLPTGVMKQESIHITLQGALTHNRWSASCSVSKSRDIPYTIGNNPE